MYYINLCFYTIYVLCVHISPTNSRTSTLWKLDTEENKIVKGSPFHPDQDNKEGHDYGSDQNPMFNIITSTVYYGDTWMKQGIVLSEYCDHCEAIEMTNTQRSFAEEEGHHEDLNCGKPVNFTYYDNLVGVINRNRHPNVPEPQIALIFPKPRKFDKELDLEALEKKLKKAKREKPKSVYLYNQIGNYFRLTGDCRLAIECFRRALALAPHHADTLLSLARVLFHLQYMDDAIYLTRRSLELQQQQQQQQPSTTNPGEDKHIWRQYFTLGEIFKQYGHYQKATVHLRHALELRPGFEPATAALREMVTPPGGNTVHVYTLVIIVCLVFGVLLVILSSVDITDTDYHEVKTHTRHFNKAMAMRSLRGLTISQKNSRTKRSAL